MLDKNEEIAREAIQGLRDSSKEEKDKSFEKILEILKIPKSLYLKRIEVKNV